MRKDDILKDCIQYFGGEDMPAGVWIDKYALHDGDEILEHTPDEMHRRLAREFARIEKKYGGENQLTEQEIFELFKDFKYIIPGGSVMSGLGNKNYRGSLSNCFVIEGPKDSYASIDRSRERMTSIFKMRGGVGVDLSGPRPAGAKVSNAAGESTGPVSFMPGYSHKVREVAQAGRRGALMISFSCLHPDVEEFIVSKQEQGAITGANISVRFTDDFMEAVEHDEEFLLRFPIDTDITNVDVDSLPLNQKVFVDGRCFKKVKAKEIWDKFVHCAWNTAEPGLMFSDRQVSYSPDGIYPRYKGITTNPCGEIFMQPFDSCRLMHINFKSFVDEKGQFDFEKFSDVCRKAIRLADDLVELELEAVDRIIDHIYEDMLPEEEDELDMWEKIRDTGRRSRRTGVGGTALADAYALAGIDMANEENLAFAEKIARAKFNAELKEEVLLAKERGAFFGWDFMQEFSTRQDIDALGVVETVIPRNPFYEMLLNEVDEDTFNEYRKYGRRNVSWSTMAPTGTVSLMTQTSSGIEPLFMCYNYRKRKCTKAEDRVDYVDPTTGDKFTVYNMVHKPFKDWVKANMTDYDRGRSFDEQATEEKLQEWYEKSPWYKNLAADLTPAQHVKLQAVFQKYVTASISKTCNLPKEATEQDISDIYMTAWKTGCKGCTVFREGSRPAILGKIEKEDNTVPELLHPAPTRPEVLPCVIKRFNNHKEKWVACIGLYKDKNGYHPYEIFTGLAEKLDIPAEVEEGKIVKVKVKDPETGKRVSQFDLVYYLDGAEHTVYGINRIFNREFYNWGLALSGFLRQGMGVEYVIKQLDKFIFSEDELSINSWRNGVKTALKRYVKDGDVNGDRCPVCGSPLRRENGCAICVNPECKWTACGS